MGGNTGALAICSVLLLLCNAITLGHAQCADSVECEGTMMCHDGSCQGAQLCNENDIQMVGDVIELRGDNCKVIFEQILVALPESIIQDGTEWDLLNSIEVHGGVVLEIHGDVYADKGSTEISLLNLMSDSATGSFVTIMAKHGKISIHGTEIRSWDVATSAPNTGLSGRPFIAALSSEDGDAQYLSRMDVMSSEISYLGNEGDFVNDTSIEFGLVWKVEGFDNRFPDVNADVFDRIGVFGEVRDSMIHDNNIGAYCFGLKGEAVWEGNEVYDNVEIGINLQDHSNDVTLSDNYVHDNNWHGIEMSRNCLNTVVTNNIIEDNGRAGVFWHQSSDFGEAYDNQLARNIEGEFGVSECTGINVHDNTMEGGRYGIRYSLGARDCEFVSNYVDMPTDQGVFTFRGSDTPLASADIDGRPRNIIIRNNRINQVGDKHGVAITGSDEVYVVDNVFTGIDSFRLDDALDTKIIGNTVPVGTSFNIDNGATISPGSQDNPEDGSEDGFQGCYQNMADDLILSDLVESNNNMTADNCRGLCDSGNYTFSGTQNSNECWCGESDDEDFKRHGLGNCNLDCTGALETRVVPESCGGESDMSVYATVHCGPDYPCELVGALLASTACPNNVCTDDVCCDPDLPFE